MNRLLSSALCLALAAVPATTAWAAVQDVSANAVCRGLRNEERVRCVGEFNAKRLRARYGSTSSSSSSSSSVVPVSYPDTFQEKLLADPDAIPDGASCIRFIDARRAKCRVERMKELRKKIDEGTFKPSSSSAPGPSKRRHCMRLAEPEKTECLREARDTIDVITRTVK